jgi:hypothetical protein
MSTLAETIREVLTRLGPGTETQLREILDEFDGLNLGDEDRLSVLATALAASAALHHARHKPVYLEALRTWSLEISDSLAPPPVRPSQLADDASIEDGADALVSGLDVLLDIVAKAPVTVHDRLVLELTLFAQLLGQHDANAIHLTLMAVSDALADDDFRAGRAVRAPLGEISVPLGRDACLASVAPRGVA